MAGAPNIFDYLDFRKFLRDFIEEKRKENPAFSIRLLAYRLGCDAGFFNRVIGGARNLSNEHTLKLGEVLKLNAKERHYFGLLVNYAQAKKQMEKDHHFRQLDMYRAAKVKQTPVHQHALYAEWFYVVLRELIGLAGCRKDSPEVHRCLANLIEPRVPPDQIRQALEVLDELGMLRRKPDGTLGVKESFITSGTEIPQVVVNRILLQFMDLAKLAVDCCPREQRSLSTLTFSVSKRGYDAIREKADQFRRDVLAQVEADPDPVDRVYHLNMHLFPVSKVCSKAVK